MSIACTVLPNLMSCHTQKHVSTQQNAASSRNVTLFRIPPPRYQIVPCFQVIWNSYFVDNAVVVETIFDLGAVVVTKAVCIRNRLGVLEVMANVTKTRLVLRFVAVVSPVIALHQTKSINTAAHTHTHIPRGTGCEPTVSLKYTHNRQSIPSTKTATDPTTIQQQVNSTDQQWSLKYGRNLSNWKC